ncbi:hypothetical protein [Lutibacter sp.]|uniref:hypothetical protein n=1 Tax=Lutibacter sp. TaxID=1925666 RepID=UPI0035694A9A
MKNLLKGTTLVVLLSITMILFTSNSINAQSDNGLENMTIVEVVKGQTWYYFSPCGTHETEKTTVQLKDGNTHLVTLVFQLPKDHCKIMDYAYTEDIDGYRVVFNPSGKMIVKLVQNE